MNLNLDLDLDINNYDLKDLLNLFNMPFDFDESDLKKAKGIVLRIHPDISKLDADYFRFYSKAYKMIYSIWQFRKKGDVEKAKNTDYTPSLIQSDKKILLDQLFGEKTDPKAFNVWFNEQFQKNQIKSENEEKGYDHWLRSNDNNNVEDDNLNGNISSMGQAFDRKKEKARALVVYKDVEDIHSASSAFYDLSSEAPTSFDSDMFSSLPYQDLQKAHVETVIPVTYEDYEQREKFGSVNDIIAHRGRQDMKPLSEQQAKDYLANRTKNEEETSTRRAYNLAKQTELAGKKQQEFWASIRLLKG